MKNPLNLKNKIIKKYRLQDIIFIVSILVFSTILVIGLFPKNEIEESGTRTSFIYLIMILPVLVAIYFIFISFKRKLYSNISEISSGITFKIGLSFVSFAILPSLMIILISNNIINSVISELLNDKSKVTIEESLKMSYERIDDISATIENEILTLKNMLDKNELSLSSYFGRKKMTEILHANGFKTLYCKIDFYEKENTIFLQSGGNYSEVHINGLTKFMQNIENKETYRIHNLSISETSILLGILNFRNNLVVIYKAVPDEIYTRIDLFKESLSRFDSRVLFKTYWNVEARTFLLLMAIIIVFISLFVSIIISRTITRPVLELAEAAGDIASGNFDVNMKRETEDELAVLFKSFNDMAMKLEQSRKIMFQAQKLEAWREVAKRLLHEIKNPLTPIRLSAERMRKKASEKAPELENIIINGTDTIIEEVDVLMKMSNEFSKFARLPEMKGEYLNINPVIESSVNFFNAHEGISFDVSFDNSLPDLFIDKALFRQALTNLLQNAVDAISGKGTISVKTELIQGTKNKTARIRIKDTGIGIKVEDIDKIFDPSFSRKESGTGLGLAIVEKIILEHFGKIYCTSKYGEWTEFTIDLPVTIKGDTSIGQITHS